MKVMLIQAEPPEDIQDFNFPMGYAALDTVLTQAGHEVKLLFTVAYHLTEQDIFRQLQEYRPDVVGIGGMWPYLPRVEMLVQLIREAVPEAKVVLGGWMVTYLPELVYRKAKPDYAIAGEGEIAFPKLVNALAGGEDVSGIPGLTYSDGGQIINNGLGELISLDELPLPTWEKFPMEYYLRVGWYFNSFCTGYDRVMGWATSRGCPGRCNFCTPGTKLRYKDMDLLMGELHEIEDRFHPTFMYWMDNLTTGSISYGKRFAQALIDEKFKFRYFLTGRVDRVDRELLRMLKRSGCVCILYGLESANNDLLKFMGKRTTVEQFKEAVQMTKDEGIAVNISGMFGQPGETLDDFWNTLQLIMTASDRRMPYSNNQGFYPLTTFPGAPIYDWAKENGYFKDDDEFYDKFFNDRWINFTNYPRKVVQQALNAANLINTWSYHHHKALSLEDSLLYTQAMRQESGTIRGFAQRLKESLDAAPKLKARVKSAMDRSSLFKRMVYKALGRDEQTKAPLSLPDDAPQAQPTDAPPAASPATAPAGASQPDQPTIDPSWPAEKQLDVFIELIVKRYLLAGGEQAVVGSRQAGTLAAAAKGFYDKKEYAEAANLYQQAVECDPTDATAWAHLGWAHQFLGQFEQAELAFRAGLELAQPSHMLLRGHGWACYKLAKYDQAVQSFDRAVEYIDPDQTDLVQETSRGRAWCLFHLGRYEPAVEDFERALAHTDPANENLIADFQNGLRLSRQKLGQG